MADRITLNSSRFLEEVFEPPSDRIQHNPYRGCDVKEWINEFQGLLKDITSKAEDFLTPYEYKNFIYDSNHPATGKSKLFELKLEDLRNITLKYFDLHIIPIFDWRVHMNDRGQTTLILLHYETSLSERVERIFWGWLEVIKITDIFPDSYRYDDFYLEDSEVKIDHPIWEILKDNKIIGNGLNLRHAKILLSEELVEDWIQQMNNCYDLQKPNFSLDMTWCFNWGKRFFWEFPTRKDIYENLSSGFNLRELLTMLQTFDTFKDETINPKSLWRISFLLADRGFFQKVKNSANDILKKFIHQEINNIQHLINLDKEETKTESNEQ